MQEKMEEEFDDHSSSDIVLELIDPIGHHRDVYVHKKILMANSDYFKSLLSPQFRKIETKVVAIEVPNIQITLDLLRWMYSGKTEAPPEQTWQLANMWLIPEIEIINYPGPSGRFIKDPKGGSWEIGDIPVGVVNKEILRRIEYVSTNPESMIQTLGFYQFKDKNRGVTIRLWRNYKHFDEYEKKKEKFKEYLNTYSSSLSKLCTGGGIVNVHYLEGRKDLTRLVLENNEFSPEDREFINKKIFDGKLFD